MEESSNNIDDLASLRYIAFPPDSSASTKRLCKLSHVAFVSNGQVILQLETTHETISFEIIECLQEMNTEQPLHEIPQHGIEPWFDTCTYIR